MVIDCGFKMAKKHKYDELTLRKSTLIYLPDGAKIGVRILKEGDKKLHSYVNVDREEGLGVLSRQDAISISWATKKDFGSGHKTIVESMRLPKGCVSLFFDAKKRQLYRIKPDRSKNSHAGKT